MARQLKSVTGKIDDFTVEVAPDLPDIRDWVYQAALVNLERYIDPPRNLLILDQKSEGLLERDSIVEAAQTRADQILEQAHLDAEATRREADQYVLETLTNLEIEMERVINQVRNGIRALQHTQMPPGD